MLIHPYRKHADMLHADMLHVMHVNIIHIKRMTTLDMGSTIIKTVLAKGANICERVNALIQGNTLKCGQRHISLCM